MISVIAYGRNDERGYGMHKRVALSLNAIAEILSAPTSEIIFIDYNTPNHLPTLPELIRDILTEKARVRTRVLRVRPSLHARFAAFSPLPVLEPVARNIALRRSRPQNRWILSTNTDAIIVPPAGQSLCELVGRLEDTHYGAPRFELPERLWEAFDRMDPVGTMAQAAEWGRRARLDEIVRGQGAVQFDNPGDFQLVRRSILFAIDGFDEEALLGWHVDHNLAHRVRLRHGPERDLGAQVKLYHCGHARQPTATHSYDRVENDELRFVHHVREPGILRQRDQWGCVDDRIEEIDLQQSSIGHLIHAIERTIPPLAGPPLEAAYTSDAYDALWYDAGHVGVHLLDLLSTYPRDAAVGFTGCRQDVLGILARGLGALGFERRLIVSEDVAGRMGIGEATDVDVWPQDRITREANVLVFEFGLIRDGAGASPEAGVRTDWTEEESRALENVSLAFMAAVQYERETFPADQQERMLIAVNSVNSRFERLVASSLVATPSPFSTRLRYGAILREAGTRATDSTSPEAALRAADILIARANFAMLLRDNFAESPQRLLLASHARLISSLLRDGKLAIPAGISQSEIERRLAVVREPAPEYPQFPQPRGSDAPDDNALSRPARSRDFEAPQWIAAAWRVSRGVARGKIRRDGWLWERAQLLRGVSEALGREARERALLVSEHRDDVVPSLADMFRQLDVIDVRALAGNAPPVMLRPGEFAMGPHLYGEKVRLADAPELASGCYDAIILPHSAAFRHGICGIGQLMSRLRPALKPNGVFAIGGEIALTGAGRSDRPDWSIAGVDGLPRVLAEAAGLRPMRGSYTGIEAEDSALIGTLQEFESGLPVLGVRRDGEVFWPACWFFVADGDHAVSADIDSQLANLLLGDQVAALRLPPGSVREGRTIRRLRGQGEGYVFYGPYIRIPTGAYQARIVVGPESPARSGEAVRLVAEVALGQDIVIQQQVDLAPGEWDRPVLFELEFVVTPEWSVTGEARTCEIRLWSSGKAEFYVLEVELYRT